MRGNDIDLKDFDLMGIMELTDVSGIEDLVTPIGRTGKFISRSSKFWQLYTGDGARLFREDLKSRLPFLDNKKAFVVLEYMATLSGKSYYEQVVRAVCGNDYSKIAEAKKCLFDDVKNIISLIEKKGISLSDSMIPQGDYLLPQRNIECDNMALLYAFTRCCKIPKSFCVLNPGLGGIFTGPFFSVMYGNDWSNIVKSKYVSDYNPSVRFSFLDTIADKNLLNKKGQVFLLDDNVGTGDTMRELSGELLKNNYNVKTGAVQYNWVNYYRVTSGDKVGINKFYPNEFTFVSPFNYPGHKMLKHSIEIICGIRAADGSFIERDLELDGRNGEFGQNYLDYKLSKHYSIYPNDLLAMQEKGYRYADKAGFSFATMDENNQLNMNPALVKRLLIFFLGWIILMAKFIILLYLKMD